MKRLTVRTSAREIAKRLRTRATKHARLRAALAGATKTPFKAFLLEMPPVGDDRDFARPTRPSRGVSL